ncbi:MAG TPA: CoA-binding protein [Lacipirellulaceae bacterium]|nr:CoA-binding protein [Lacipirellulaceae bacterium]
MSPQDKIQIFLSGKRFAVVGASQDRTKYGNKVLRVYQQNKRNVVPINPMAEEVEGLKAYPDLASVPGDIDGISIITPPRVTERVVNEAIQRGIKHIWMQPGAESNAAVKVAEQAGANVIAGGPCILVALRYHEDHD